MDRRNLISGLGWVVLTILSWAPTFSVAKRVLAHIDPFTMSTLRYLLGVVLLVMLLVAVEGRSALRYEGRFLPAALFGLIGVTGFNLFVWIGLLFTLPEHAAVINGLQVPMTALAVWLLRGQRPAGFTLACVAFAIVGVVLVVTKADPASAFRGGTLIGDAVVFLAAVCWVIYILAAAQFPGWSPLRLTVLTCIPGMGGILVANVIAAGFGWTRLPDAATLVSLSWALVYLSVCTVVLGVLGFNNAARKLGPLNTMLMLSAIPVVVFGIEAALGRSFGALELAGAVVVVGALVANNLYLRKVSRPGAERLAPPAASGR